MAITSAFPTRYELKWAGWSLVLITALWVVVGVVFSIVAPDTQDYTAYTVRNDEDVVSLHEFLSDPDYRVYVEYFSGVAWMTFPFLLVVIYVIRKLFLSMFVDTPMEMWVYAMEKAYILTLLITNIMGPALCLVMVSFEWDLLNTTQNGSEVPTGYYIQLYVLLVVEELYDAVCIADGLFLFLMCIIPQFRYCTQRQRFQILKQHGMTKTLWHMFLIVLAFTVGVAYLISLFRFADSGFFSLNGGAAWFAIYGFIFKFCIGVRLLIFAHQKRYDDLKKAFDVKTDLLTENTGSAAGTGDIKPGNWDTIEMQGKKDATDNL